MTERGMQMRAVFVAGTGRSGTSVTRRVLARHPDVAAMPGELRLIIDPGGLLDLWDAFQPGRWDFYQADHAIETFRRMVNGQQHLTDAWVVGDEDVRDWLRERTEALVGDLVLGETVHGWSGSFRDHMYETVRHDPAPALRRWVTDLYRRRVPDATHFVEDSPYNALHAPRLRRVFPGARFLIVMRHPLDILASWVEGKHFWTPTDPRYACSRIRAAWEGMRDLALGGENSVLLKVEEMTARPVEVFRDACRGLGIRTEGVDMADVCAPIDPDAAHIGRRRELTEKQEAVGRSMLGDMIQTLGYE